MKSRSKLATLIALCGLVFAGAPFVMAQEDSPPAQRESDASDGSNGGALFGIPEEDLPDGKRMTAARTPRPPVIDGLLDEREWQLTEVVSDFMQREPDNLQPGSERTEARILYDDENIYIGFVLYDSQPDKIAARDLRRDSHLRNDDAIAVMFDTFHDHRNGFLFRVNPLGTRYDATYRNEREVNSDWDEDWQAAAQITDEGWQVEMMIPLRILRFPSGTHVWGIDFKRELRRRNEEMNWSNYRRGFRFNQISQAGHIIGLQNLQLTKRFRLKPYITGGGTQFNITDEPVSEGTGDIGIEDFKVQITTNLTADFTVNTDFAQVEDDDVRVNLTRFSLFFPEKREFFLESAKNFSFGQSARFGGHEPPLIALYHSRNIGLEAGQPVPILFGAKLTGKIGSTNLGLLNVQTDDSQFGFGENYTAIRVRQDVLNRSSVGAIFTNVQNGEGDYNRVSGVDANLRFWDYLSINGFVAQSNDARFDGSEYAGRFSAGWDSDLWTISGDYTRIDPEFRSDLGFVLRRDVERQSYNLAWKPRPGWSAIRQFRFSGRFEYLTTTGGVLETRNRGITWRTQFESGDNMFVDFGDTFDRLFDGFYLTDGVFIPPGDYSWQDGFVHFSTYSARPVSMRMTFSGGGFYDGTRYSIGPSGTIRFNENFSISPGYEFNTIDVSTGSFTTHVVRTRVTYNFNTEWLTSSQIQYNSVDGEVSVFARLNYIYRTNDNFYVVFRQTRRVEGFYRGASDRSLLAKLTYSWDF